MSKHIRTFAAIALCCAPVLFAACGSDSSEGPGPDPDPEKKELTLVSPGEQIEGKSFEAWSAAWWQWQLGIPVDQNPVMDATGKDCAVGQSGPVWFLAGTFGGEVARSCAIPAGKHVMFPIVNYSFFNCPEESYTVAEMDQATRSTMDNACNLKVTIDGEVIAKPESYRAHTAPFSAVLPANNVWAEQGACEGVGDGPPAGERDPMVADGYWILIESLPAGDHTIVLHGEVCDPDTGETQFETQVSYTITVEG